MCVAITLAPGTYLEREEVIKMDRSNADGVGVAWAEDGVVQWYKTTKVDPDYICKMIHAYRELPRLVHFRYATVGGIRPELCHPFEIGPEANCAPRGAAAKVMIHNGHWGRWQEVHTILQREGLLPSGPWSDSRLAALMANEDPGWFEALGGRVAVMRGDGEVHRMGDWQELRKGLFVSNKSWVTATAPRGGYTGYRQWPGWGFSEEEHDAFFAEQEAKAKAEEAIALKAAKDEWKANKERKGAEKAAAKQARAQARRDASRAVDGQTDGGAGESDSCCRSERNPGADVSSGVPLPRVGEGLPAATTPAQETIEFEGPAHQASNGKWYRNTKRSTGKGTTIYSVVEVLPPSPAS